MKKIIHIVLLKLTLVCTKNLRTINKGKNIHELNDLIKKAREGYIKSLSTSITYMEADLHSLKNKAREV